MTLGLAISRFADHLAATMADPPARIGGAAPTKSAEVPALVLSVSEAVEVVTGVGNVPRPPPRGPWQVVDTISVADPVLHFPDGDVPLVSDGGTVVQLPHGGLVHSDGAPPPPPLGAADLKLTLDGAELTYVAGAPGAGQFTFDRAAAQALGYGDPDSAGVVRLGQALAGTALVARYWVGEYEVSTQRYRGQLAIDVFAGSAAAVDTLSEAVAAVLRPGVSTTLGTAYVLTPTSWGPIVAPDHPLGNARHRTITWRFDVELEEVRLPFGGGIIGRVDVETRMDAGTGSSSPLPADVPFSVPYREETP